jgi:hypothetical protein
MTCSPTPTNPLQPNTKPNTTSQAIRRPAPTTWAPTRGWNAPAGG